MDVMCGSGDSAGRTSTEDLPYPVFYLCNGSLIFSNGKDNLDVWIGWDATLIESKQGKTKRETAQDDYGKKIGGEESSWDVTIEQCMKLYTRKRKRRKSRTLNSSERVLYPVKALQIGFQSAAIPKWKFCEKAMENAKAVTALISAIPIRWVRLKKLLSSAEYETVRKSVFSSATQLVLSIFDAEDFERVYDKPTVFKKFYSKLKELKLEDEDHALKAIADGTMDVKEFSTLGEYDVGQLLQNYKAFSENGHHYQVSALQFKVLPSEQLNVVSSSDVMLVRSEIKKYKPLKKDRKMQLTLELMHLRSFRVLDTLLVEAWKDIKFNELAGYLASKSNTKIADSLSYVDFDLGIIPELSDIADCLLNHFVGSIQSGVLNLAYLKASALHRGQEFATFPISCGVFGRFANDVFEVVWMADYERRTQGHRFISVHHILFALSLSRVSDFVDRILGERLYCLAKEPSKVPIYIVYKLAADEASSLEDEVVQLEHLVLAIGRKLQGELAQGKWEWFGTWETELLQRLKKKDLSTNCCFRIWKDEAGLKWLPEKCFSENRVACDDVPSVEELIRGFENNLVLPEIR